MENTPISLQYTPSFMEDVVVISAPENPTHTVAPAAPGQPGNEPELVDFHLTEPAIQSLKGVLVWSKILVFCYAVIILIEMMLALVFGLTLFYSKSIEAQGVFLLLRSGVSIGVTAWLGLESIRFNRQMGRAIKSNDNPALAEAFRHQATFFKWVFLNLAITAGFAIVNVLF